MIDEIKIEECPRWDDRTNNILGLCQQHTGHLDLNFCSIEVAKLSSMIFLTEKFTGHLKYILIQATSKV